jgi:hypothetical protein
MSEWQAPPPYPGQPGQPGAPVPPPAYPAPQGYPTPPGYQAPGSQPPGYPPPGYPTPPSYPTPPAYSFGPVGPTDPLVSPDYSGWFRNGVNIVKRGWQQLAALQVAGIVLALVVSAPVAAFLALQRDDLTKSVTNASTTEASPADLSVLIPVVGLSFAGIVVSFILTAIITLATVHVAASAAAGVQPNLGNAVRLAGRRVFPLIGWQLLFVPIALVALCACVLPVIYVAAVASVLAAVVAIERTNAVARCFALFNNNVGVSASRIATIFGISIAAGLVSSVIGSIFDVSVGANGGTGAIITASVIGSVVSAVVSGAAGILTAPLALAAYADMRARKDGITGATILYELGIPAQGAPSASFG